VRARRDPPRDAARRDRGYRRGVRAPRRGRLSDGRGRFADAGGGHPGLSLASRGRLGVPRGVGTRMVYDREGDASTPHATASTRQPQGNDDAPDLELDAPPRVEPVQWLEPVHDPLAEWRRAADEFEQQRAASKRALRREEERFIARAREAETAHVDA